MPVDTSESDFEAAIVNTMTDEEGEAVSDPSVDYRAGSFTAGGYRQRDPGDYNRERCLIPEDLYDFVVATQPEEWNALKENVGGDAKTQFAQRVSREIDARGTLNVLRRGVNLYGCRFDLVYFEPSTGRNPELQEKYRANVFSVVRQLPYSTSTGHTLDLCLFLNGLPLFTAELKNPLTGQTFRDAIHQYRSDRDPREPFFQFGRCLAHFAVGSEEVHMTTELEGEDTTFLPFNRGYDGGAGNPPSAHGYRTSYLWEQVWTRDSVLNLLQHFIAKIEEVDGGEPTGEEKLIFPRYHQMRAVRRLVGDDRENGPGGRYLIQHSAGSGKSISIAVLAHQLAFLHDEDDASVFDTVIVVTDRRVLDKQIAQVILQFEQERGVVADIEEGAAGLGRALASGKRIVVVTLQTFPHVAEAIREQGQRDFAVIIDEAHSSQTGEYRKHLNDTLSASSLKEAEEEDETEDADLEDKIMAEIEKRGHQPNVSNFAFTATPKSKTLELFGEEQPGGGYEPFDVYSMRQAIDEGFILDVLQNYTTYNDYFRLLKRVEDDPRYDTKQASRLLKSFVSVHEHTIREKVKIIAEHFATKVAHRVGGKAKSMIVTRSRLHAVRFKRVLDDYLDEQGYAYDALVAFSGIVEDEGIEYTEASMNGFSDARTRSEFERDEYRFLVVANKFQTGFDQPLLHTMYVDKKLGGVNAVQTLSRLNRTHPEKEETMVLDFVNDAEDIQGAFEPYYERTTLQEGTDPNRLYDLEHQIREFGIITDRDLEEFAELWHEGGTQKELHSVLDRCVDRYDAATEEEQTDFRRQIGRYVRLYAFLAQVVPFEDVELEKLYILAKPLLSKLLARLDPSDVPEELVQYVDIDSYRIQESGSGSVEIEQGEEPLSAQSGGRPSSSGPSKSEEKPLSAILERLNEQFGYDFTEEDRVFIKQLKKRVQDHDAVQKSIEVNEESAARLTFDDVAEDELQGMVDRNFKLYRKITDNEAFGRMLFDFLFDRTLEEVREEAAEG
ncbi:type I restriction endonuclease subunit R [Salinibacter ruber]|uniref:type I restriction endonuclease subunit R n=1 Tax=Salinibacter ruber TaxID=146919 RepID=UPI0021671654|nr:type I restriction endonuclease [Salinibacter ruber]MCS4038725.1 type I restriction enzyme R subunit [Salinibacter ruber]